MIPPTNETTTKPKRERKTRKAIKFTDLSFRNLKPDDKGFEVRDGHQRGLYLRIRPNGSKTWLFRFRYGGKPSVYVLQAGIGVAQARKLASDAAFMLAQGKDPRAARRDERERAVLGDQNTVQAICENYMKIEGKKLRSADGRASILRRLIYPHMGHRQITEVERDEVVRMLDKVAEKNGEAASDMALAVVHKIFGWHERRSSRFRSPLVKGMFRRRASDHARTRTLDDAEIRRIWRALDDPQFAVFGPCLRFTFLTACRRSESSKMLRSEVDEHGVWTLSGLRSKTGEPVVRPLSKAAFDIVRAQPQIGESQFVFTRTGRAAVTLNDMRLKRLFDDIVDVHDWTIHDLRRTARSLLSRLRVSYDIAELMLGHRLPGGLIRRTYDQFKYHDQLREAADRLAAEVERIVEGKTGKLMRFPGTRA
jgi:hypothetical protein